MLKNCPSSLVFEANNDQTFMKCKITDDEKWVYQFDMETNQHLAQWRFEDERTTKENRIRRENATRKATL